MDEVVPFETAVLIQFAKSINLIAIVGMNLPNLERAYIPSAKLYDYLLSASHSVGKSKARFLNEFGFNESNVGLLKSGLLSIAYTEKVVEVVETPFGAKYIVDGSLLTPAGITINIRTVWIIEKGENAPRFVTAHPRPK